MGAAGNKHKKPKAKHMPKYETSDAMSSSMNKGQKKKLH